MTPPFHGAGGIPARAWLDDAHAEWDREARSYGPDDDDDLDADDDDSPDDDRDPTPKPRI